MKESPLLVFSTQKYLYLRDSLCTGGEFQSGRIETRIFPDGERYRCLLDNPDARRVILIGGTISDTDTLELYDLGCAISKLGAYSLTMVIPYFGYSTMERAEKPLEVVTAKTRARLLSTIPPAGISNRVIMVDLHTPGLPHYFEGCIQTRHLYARPVILEACRRLGGEEFVLACTDAGRAKWVESLANDLGVSAAFLLKRRLSDDRVEVTEVQAEVKGKKVVIYDDMIRTGGSLIQAARAYRTAGASEISALATHGVLPEGALKKLQESGLFHRLVTTDTHPAAVKQAGDFLELVSISGLLLKCLRSLP
ncbi:MAG: ribose-phosphate diphosphokinase [Vulcanimicrobiota bacterium]